MRSALLLLLFVALAMPTVARAKDSPPVSLPMTSKWEINYDDDSCHLLARFGQENDQVIMRMTRFEPGSKFDLMFYGSIFRTTEAWSRMKFAFGDGTPFERTVGAGTNGQLPFMLALSVRFDSIDTTLSPPSDDVRPAQEARINSITIAPARGKARRLETGSMAAPMQAMRACTTDLIRSWGYDPEKMATLSKPPISKSSPAAWITDKDYPSSALSEGQSSIVKFRLDVDETGTVAGCHILRRLKPAEFDKITCQLISRRARFDPALDAAGNPIKAYYVNTVRFVMASD